MFCKNKSRIYPIHLLILIYSSLRGDNSLYYKMGIKNLFIENKILSLKAGEKRNLPEKDGNIAFRIRIEQI